MNYRQLYKELGINSYESMPAIGEIKECSICHEEKPVEAFCNNKKYSYIDGRHPWCIDCTHEINEDRSIQEKYAKPTWFSNEHIKELFALSNEVNLLEKVTGIKHSVCHIEPIQHWLVCGLDISVNMYVDTQENNAKQSNWFMPYHQLPDGTIEHIEIPLEFILDAYTFNERFNRQRNKRYKDRNNAV